MSLPAALLSLTPLRLASTHPLPTESPPQQTKPQPPGSTVQIVPQINWGFGGMYMLNNPAQQTLNFNPPNQFFPVASCVSITDVATGGSLQLANGGPNNQQFCVNGNQAPFQQPAPIQYQVTAPINPSTTADCQAGGQKTYSVRGVGAG
jgi:hypothetical protein